MRVIHTICIVISKKLVELIAIFWSLRLVNKHIFLNRKVGIECLGPKEIVNRN
jgi:hypothetical protein